MSKEIQEPVHICLNMTDIEYIQSAHMKVPISELGSMFVHMYVQTVCVNWHIYTYKMSRKYMCMISHIISLPVIELENTYVTLCI